MVVVEIVVIILLNEVVNFVVGMIFKFFVIIGGRVLNFMDGLRIFFIVEYLLDVYESFD